MSGSAPVAAIIPARDEAESIGFVVGELLASVPGIRVIVVDNGSQDGTADVARSAGAVVVPEPRAGYGRACNAGIEALSPDVRTIVFLDGDGSDCATDIPGLLSAIEQGADLALGVRRGPGVEAGAIAPAARFGNWLCGWLLWAGWGRRLHDLSPMKAITAAGLQRLARKEQTYGWTIELLALALQEKLIVVEVETGYRHRRAGESKVSGDLRGSVRAGVRILATVARVRGRTLDGAGAKRLSLLFVAVALALVAAGRLAVANRGPR